MFADEVVVVVLAVDMTGRKLVVAGKVGAVVVPVGIPKVRGALVVFVAAAAAVGNEVGNPKAGVAVVVIVVAVVVAAGVNRAKDGAD